MIRPCTQARGFALAAIMVAGVALSGCTAFGPRTPAQVAEVADTDASALYAAIATAINAYEALPEPGVAAKASAEALKVKAWQALQVERQAYAAGQTIDLTALREILAAARNLGH